MKFLKSLSWRSTYFKPFNIISQYYLKNINAPWNKILPVAASPKGLEVSWISETDPVIDLSPVLAVTY